MPSVKPVYVAGAGGFIGGELRRRFPNLDIRPINRVPKGGTFPNFEEGSCVVHLAARVHVMRETAPDPLAEFMQVNCGETIRLAETALRSGVRRFIFASSVSVFGRFRAGTIGDDALPAPDDPYGISKLEAEKGLNALFRGWKGAQCVVLRLPMVYGPGNKGNMIPLLKAASKGLPLPIAGARGKRSMLFSGNLASAINQVILDKTVERPLFQTYFLNDGWDCTSAELYSIVSGLYTGKKGVFYFPRSLLDLGADIGSLLEKITHRQVPINKAVISRLFDEYRFSNQRFCSDYGWSPPFTPDAGLRETVEWHKGINRS